MRSRLVFRFLTPFSAWVAQQLAHPQGWFGRMVMTRVLNRGNRELITSTLDALALAPEARLLDVGFGGGLALQLAREKGITRLAGVDPSSAAVEQLQQGAARWLRGGELALAQGSVEQLPFGESSFDAILSTNTVYFWSNLPGAFAELHRVLAPGGKLALGFSSNPKLRSFEGITRHGFLFHDPEAMLASARQAGFEEVRRLDLHGKNTEGDHVLLAVRSG